MTQRLFNLLTALSLLLCVAMTFACITSYALPRGLDWGDARLAVGRGVVLERGRFVYFMASNVRPIDARLHPNGDSESIGYVIRYSEECLGVNIGSWDTERSTEPGVSYGQHTEVSCEFALSIFLTALLPAWWVMRWAWVTEMRRQFIRRNNLCRRCGYDLRATPERCPECGRIAAGVEE